MTFNNCVVSHDLRLATLWSSSSHALVPHVTKQSSLIWLWYRGDDTVGLAESNDSLLSGL